MHILAVCPACQTRYQMQEALRGKTVRCPNDRCRKVFVVQDQTVSRPRPEEPPRKPSSPKPPCPPQRSGVVGELIPILPVQPNSPGAGSDSAARKPPGKKAPPAEPKDVAASWRDAPPPVRGGDAVVPLPPPKPKPREQVALPDGNGPPAKSWDAPPPVRRGPPAPEAANAAPIEEPAFAEKPPAEPPHPSPRGRGKVYAVIAGLMVFVMVGLAGAFFFVWRSHVNQQNLEFEAALKEYQDRSFRAAADKFHDLEQALPDGDRKEEARFYAALASLRAEFGEVPAPGTDRVARAEKGLAQLTLFARENKGKELLSQHTHDLGETLAALITDFAASVTSASQENLVPLLEQARAVKEQIGELRNGLTDDEAKTIDDNLAKVQDAIGLQEHHKKALAALKVMGQQPAAGAIKDFVHFIKQESDTLPGLGQEPGVLAIKNQLVKGLFASIVFQPDNNPVDPERPKDDAIPAIAVVPPPGGPGSEEIDLFMAHGVLYALERATGQFRWGMRVGQDNTTLPVRLAGGLGGRDRFLVLSHEARNVDLVDDTGTVVWRYTLGSPCVGQPLVVEQQVYLPTTDGHVQVLDLGRGQHVGQYNLGARLSTGGARLLQEGGNKLLFFPADEFCIFVLDAERNRCAGILYTGHAAGSLRSPPLIVTPENSDIGYLILNQTEGVDETVLRAFAVPKTWAAAAVDPFIAPIKLKKELRLRGWSWFAPHVDDEKIAVVTDAGRLGLFGVKQPGTSDAPFFPLLPHEPGGIRLNVLLPPDGLGRGRAQVVHSRGSDLWLLGNGKLQCVVKGEVQQVGASGKEPALTLLSEWKEPLKVGLPLHAAQVADEPGADRSTLLLATQPLAQKVCLATAVDGRSGAIRWQRQLGMVCQGEPLMLTTESVPLLLAIDQAGALFVFDPQLNARPLPGLAQSSGTRLEGPADENPHFHPVLISGANGRSAYEILSPGRGKEVWIREVRRAANRQVKVDYERQLALDAPLGGTPAVVGTRLLLPLNDGKLMWLKLPADGTAPKQAGAWRDARAGPASRAHIIALGPNHFLTTDGYKSITHWSWEAKDPIPKETWTQRNSSELAGVPLVLSPEDHWPLRLCFADARGTARVVSVDQKGKAASRPAEWNLGGRLTAGPFLRSVDGVARVGCVVDDTKLFWLDPSVDRKPLWTFPAKDHIVGEPQVIGAVVVVALQQRGFVGISSTTGQPTGFKLSCPTGVLPACSPVSFGPGRIFAPLADGTILVPEMH